MTGSARRTPALLTLAPRLGRGAAFLLAAGALFVGELNMWNYFTNVVGVPLPLSFVALSATALNARPSEAGVPNTSK